MSLHEEHDARPMGTFGYFFVEASRRLWISKRNSFVAIAMIVVSLFILGAFLLVSENLARAMDEQQARSRMIVYLSAAATAEQIAEIDTFLAQEPLLARREFITREAAAEKFRRSFPALASVLGDLGENPLPASFEITLAEEAIDSPRFRRSLARLRDLSGVDDLQFDWEWVAKLRELVRTINLIGLAVGGILGAAAVLMIANVIRLTMVLYREEIGVMRLVGATERIIRGPFLVEGFLQGLIGGVLATASLAAVYFGFRAAVESSETWAWSLLLRDFLPPAKLAAIASAGVLAGLTGSWLAVRETTD